MKAVDKNELTHLSCFSGIGGIDLAAEWAGFKTIAQIERDPFCLKILNKHWPNIPKFEDILNVTADTIRRESNAQPTVLSGGFPCQPFSTAGKRRGKDDDRYLWPEMLRLVRELRPSWVVGENVVGLLSMGIDILLSDLESTGYSCRTFVIPAVAAGAPHRRERVFIVAYSGHNTRESKQQSKQERSEEFDTGGEGRIFSYSNECIGSSKRNIAGMGGESEQIAEIWRWDRETAPEPCLCRMANGIPRRMDRLNALGNAVVPYQIYPIFKQIADIEKNYARGSK